MYVVYLGKFKVLLVNVSVMRTMYLFFPLILFTMHFMLNNSNFQEEYAMWLRKIIIIISNF